MYVCIKPCHNPHTHTYTCRSILEKLFVMHICKYVLPRQLYKCPPLLLLSLLLAALVANTIISLLLLSVATIMPDVKTFTILIAILLHSTNYMEPVAAYRWWVNKNVKKTASHLENSCHL